MSFHIGQITLSEDALEERVSFFYVFVSRILFIKISFLQFHYSRKFMQWVPSTVYKVKWGLQGLYIYGIFNGFEPIVYFGDIEKWSWKPFLNSTTGRLYAGIFLCEAGRLILYAYRVNLTFWKFCEIKYGKRGLYKKDSLAIINVGFIFTLLCNI